MFSILVRTFLIDIYYIPSKSMENTLMQTDHIIINKINHSLKVPKKIEDIPLLGLYFRNKEKTINYNPFFTLLKFKNYKKKDIVVFKSIENNKEYLVKRVMGLPGEKIFIKESLLFINDSIIKDEDTFSYEYKVFKNDSTNFLIRTISNVVYNNLTKLEQNKFKKNITTNFYSEKLFPFWYSKSENWTRDNYGSLIIPKKGATIFINEKNFIIYKDFLRKFENFDIKLNTNYKFKRNYYFLLGDNRHNSRDSRHFGFIPEDFIVGKKNFVY